VNLNFVKDLRKIKCEYDKFKFHINSLLDFTRC